MRRAVTINVCWRKSSCELFPLATTRDKVANSGSGKMVISSGVHRKFSLGDLVQSHTVVICSDGVSRLGPGLETRDAPRDPFFEVSVSVSVSKVSGLVSVSGSKDFGLDLELFVSRLCIGYFFMKFCKEFLKKTVLKNDCSKFSRLKTSVAKFSLLLCCLRAGEKICPLPRLKLILNSIKKCARSNDTAGRNLCNERLGVLC